MAIDLLTTFPFKVRFYKKGMFNLLQWYTHGEGNHIILAKDHPTMIMVWLSVLESTLMRLPRNASDSTLSALQSSWLRGTLSGPAGTNE